MPADSSTTLFGDIHAQVTRDGLAHAAAMLQGLFGQRLVAVIVGIRDPKAVGRWSRGVDIPHARTAEHLLNAYHVVRLLQAQETDDTVLAWFRGMNPDLGDRSPALVLREQPTSVMQAARAFLSR